MDIFSLLMLKLAVFLNLLLISFSSSINILNESISHGQIKVTEKCSLFYILYKSREQKLLRKNPLTIFITGGMDLVICTI